MDFDETEVFFNSRCKIKCFQKFQKCPILLNTSVKELNKLFEIDQRDCIAGIGRLPPTHCNVVSYFCQHKSTRSTEPPNNPVLVCLPA